jgi:mono/diheme cytochrome c family protein
MPEPVVDGRQRLSVLAWTASLLGGAAAVAAGPSDPGIAFFEAEIRPLLAAHCYACHSARAESVKGALVLDSKAGWEAGGDSGTAVIVPGDPDASLLIQHVRHEDGLGMPPDEQLPDEAIAKLVTWVRMGAPDPRVGAVLEQRRADRSWWSLQPLRQDEPPAADGLPADWGRHPIDRFVAHALAVAGLAPNPPADPRDLIRRMSYDLTGLPPTAEEIEAFATAHAADPDRATAALVDRLLASPRYGEQWGRHWLDVVRFGESNGYERNFVIDDLWPFRDYVIRALNDDKPFDRLIVEHLAGDVVGRGDPAVEVGSCFLVAGPYDDVDNKDEAAQANIRAATLDDIITATSGAFLGLTVNCARCHNHKFDPIPAEDYYRLRAAFEGVRHGRRVVATDAERARHAAAVKPLEEERARVRAERKTIDEAIAARCRETLGQAAWRRPKIDPQSTEDRFAPVEARHVRFVIHALTNDTDIASGTRNVRGKLTEFQVFDTAGANVALAAAGGTAAGARSARAEDFPEAYGPQLCIDGQFGEQWFIGSPAMLTITLARPTLIERIAFSNSRGAGIEDGDRGATPCEYEIQVSGDGAEWRTVASGVDREPWSEAHAIWRVRRMSIREDERHALERLDRRLADIDAALARVAPLPQVWIGARHEPPGPTRLHKGGDPMQPLDVVRPASLAVLAGPATAFELAADAPEADRRLALARWLTAADNPLPLRVLANRVWHWHFGTGLVDTPSDFGFLGGQPSHPELLDWLARRLVAHGWRLKPLHREILLSQAYRQSAAWRENGAAVDKDARLLWRFPPRRLSAEQIRDTLLFVSGRLRLEPMGGPGFRLYKFTQNNVCTYVPLERHGPETYRRAVYHQNARASVVDLLSDFDLPDIAFAAPRRSDTTSPLQALTLLNHSFTLDMAEALADRARRAAGSADLAAFVDAVFAFALGRVPAAEERQTAVELAAAHGPAALCRALFNCNELLFVE